MKIKNERQVQRILSFHEISLYGKHNFNNILFALETALFCIKILWLQVRVKKIK